MTTLTLQVTEVRFDFDDSCPYCGGDCYNDHDNACDGFLGDIDELVQQQQAVLDDVLGNVFEVEVDDVGDERQIADALVEELTDYAGWCVVSLNYRHVLS